MEKGFTEVRLELYKVYEQYKEKHKGNLYRILGFQDCFLAVIDAMKKNIK